MGRCTLIKKWTKDGYIKLVNELLKDKNNIIILTGSTSEKERNDEINKSTNSNRIIDTTTMYSIKQFCNLINLSDIVITGDTVALHIAISLQKKIVSFLAQHLIKK